MTAPPLLPQPTLPSPAASSAPFAEPWEGLEAAAPASALGITAGAYAHLRDLRDLLLRWNDRFNLTSLTDAAAVERRLILDALRMLPVLDRLSAGARGRLVDIGSGAGFPGLPLAICRPDLAVTLVEATGKKVTFLEAAVAELDLPNVRAIHARAEELGREPAHRGGFDVATARAVASLPALLELAMPLLRVGGTALFPKGLDLAPELAAARTAAPQLGARLVGDKTLPGGETRLIVARKTAPTPIRFPRRSGIPAREPLGSGPATTGDAAAARRRGGAGR